jgi:proteasome accessory factor B
VGEAVLHVQRDRAVALRRSAVSVTRLDDRTDEVVVRYASPWQVAAEAASYGPDVVVHSPPEARQLTATLLHSALDAATLDPAS